MEETKLTCTYCSHPLPGTLLTAEQDRFQACPVCNKPLRVVVFPALFRKPARSEVGESILVDGEAACFYHPTTRAEIPCDECGRFLCPVCDIDFNGRHICPACLEGNKQKPGTRPELEQSRTLYDSLALSIVLLTTLIFCLWPFWIVTGPVGVVLGFVSWSRPSSLITRTRGRAIAAIILGLIQTAAAIVLIYQIYFNQSRFTR